MNAAASGVEPGGERHLKITEIFYSLQGEADAWVLPPRVAARRIPLRCQLCDTAYAFHGGEWRSVEHAVPRSARLVQTELGRVSFVSVTGGEPLAQKNCLPLLSPAM